MPKTRSIQLTESAVALAFSTVLSMVKVVEMPYGGSVTAASLLPLILIAYRYGAGWGLFTGFTASLLQLILGLNNLSWATGFAAAVAIVMLDYILAFTFTGLGGVFRRYMSQPAALGCGALLACVIRYIAHVISGCTVWAGLSIPTGDALWYSIGYNAVYMVPETMITVAAAILIGRMLDFSKPDIAAIPRPTGKDRSRSIGGVALIVAAILDVFLLFSATQVENADGDVVFDITGILQANWWLIAAITVVALVIFFVPRKACPWAVAGTSALLVIIGRLVTADWLLPISFAAVAVVLILLLSRRTMLAIGVTPLLWDAVYLWQILPISGYAWSVEDIAALIVPPVCGVAALVALHIHQQKQRG